MRTDYTELVGKAVQVKRSDKTAYIRLIGKHGVVDRVSGSTIGVRIDGMTNESSAYGVFWFSRNEIKILDDEKRLEALAQLASGEVTQQTIDFAKTLVK